MMTRHVEPQGLFRYRTALRDILISKRRVVADRLMTVHVK